MDLLGRKQKQINQKLVKYIANQKTYTPDTFWNTRGERVSLFDFSNDAEVKKAVLHVPELAATLNYLSSAFSIGVFKVFINGEESEDNQIIELLNNPHPLYTGAYLKRYILEQLFSYGRTHLYMNTAFGRRENSENITILPAETIKTFVGDVTANDYLTGADDIIKYYEYTFNYKREIISDIENVITVTWNTEVQIVSQYLKYISPLKPLEEALQVTPAMYNVMHNLMDNYGYRGFISNKTKDISGYIPLEPDQKEEVQEEFKSFGLKKGQKQFSFINYDLEFTKVSSPIKEMLLPDQQKMIKNIIADVLNFNTVLLNKDNSSTLNDTSGSAYSEARKSMFTENLIPVGKNLTESLNDYVYKFKTSAEIKMDFSDIDVFVDDEKEIAEKTAEVTTFVIELNQAVSDPLNNMTRDNAIAVLTTNGYSTEDAEKLIS